MKFQDILRTFPRRLLLLCVICCDASICWAANDEGNAESERLFEAEIRPILVEHCLSCHGAQEQNGALRLDSGDAVQQGGESGAVLVAGNAEKSLLIQAVLRSGDLAMPPDDALTAAQVESLKKWVDSGAVWPRSAPLADGITTAAREHWGFRAITNPSVPEEMEDEWCQNPIDAFVLRQLRRAGLRPSKEADRRTQLRRLSYSLTGLPPSMEAVRLFAANDSKQAYDNAVTQLLQSPQYGEHWARHWLDVARYSDTKGYVYAREERFWVHAWRYRDWVVNALNEDMPYDRFLMLQLAADQMTDIRTSDLPAMGFLTIGRRFLGVERDIIDDRIDVVTRGTMGLTVSCARCHNHKYDPVPTSDYYALYGVFDSCVEQFVRIDAADHGDEYEAELNKRQQELTEELQASRDESSARARSRIRDYLYAQTELHKYPPKGFDQVFEKSDLLPAFVRRWEAYLKQAHRDHHPVFIPWHRFQQLSADMFATQAVHVTEDLKSTSVNRIVLNAFDSPPKDFVEVIDRYAGVFQEVDRQWQMVVRSAAESQQPLPTSLPDAAAEELRGILYGSHAPSVVPDEPVVHTESFFDSGTCNALWKLQGEVDRWVIQAATPPEYALILKDRDVPSEPQVFRRGNPLNKGEDVPRRFLTALSEPDDRLLKHGSGRLELAQKIASADNPLTARVIVNRVWMHHFGKGLVTTPSDFGLRAAAPSHPELLDWLTSHFISSGWSLKELHRLILTSATYRQSSEVDTVSVPAQQANLIDPGNRLLWRMNSRRLTFEQFRDSMLAASGELSLAAGGKPQDLFNDSANTRRTLYGVVDRQFFPTVLRVFDFANPDLHVARRNQTTVPQQALFFMNHPLVLNRVQHLATDVHSEVSLELMVTELFRRILQREPEDSELLDAVAHLQQSSSKKNAPRLTSADWSYGYGRYDEATQRVQEFRSLPHFNGTAWQGGTSWPDPQLGWVQLSADGGHPGNTREMASVRRWTVPRDMVIMVRSKLVHEPEVGDGIRGFVVSSKDGKLAAASVHHSHAELNVDRIAVMKGETIDFVVDIDRVLNSDQYLWHVEIAEKVPEEAAAAAAMEWNSALDFTPVATHRLNPVEQLAQVLFCSNEFLFVD